MTNVIDGAREKMPGVDKEFSPDRDALAKVIKKVSLTEICLIKCQAELGSMEMPKDGSVRQYRITVDVVESKPVSNDFWVICDLGLREIQKPAEEAEASELFKIEASFQLSYNLSSRKGITKKDVMNFGVINGPYNAWSFWREYVQNMTLRMGVGPIVVPLKPPTIPSKVALRKNKSKPIQ